MERPEENRQPGEENVANLPKLAFRIVRPTPMEDEVAIGHAGRVATLNELKSTHMLGAFLREALRISGPAIHAPPVAAPVSDNFRA